MSVTLTVFAALSLLTQVPASLPVNPATVPPPTQVDVGDPCPLLSLPEGCSQPPPPPPPPPPTATVQPGDTLSELAMAWGVDLAVVETANSWIGNPDAIEPGWVLAMPGGKQPPPRPPQPVYTATVGGSSTNASHISVAAVGNHFSFGYCTWYVANRRPIPWFGDAGQWGPNARAMGFPEGMTPRPGAIYVGWDGPVGHVAYVEAVNADGSYVVSEMNYNAWDVVDTRTIRPGSVPLETFIY